MIWGKLPILQWLYLGIPGEEGQALLLQIHCHSLGSNAHTQGTPAAPSWGRGTARPPFQRRFLAGHLSCFPQGRRARAGLPTGTLPVVEPPQHGVSPHTCFNYIPFPNTDQTPSTNIALNGVHCLAMLMPSRGLRAFLSCGYHRVVSCHSFSAVEEVPGHS